MFELTVNQKNCTNHVGIFKKIDDVKELVKILNANGISSNDMILYHDDSGKIYRGNEISDELFRELKFYFTF